MGGEVRCGDRKWSCVSVLVWGREAEAVAGSLNWPISVLSLPAASLAIQHKLHQEIRDTQLNNLITTCRNPLKARNSHNMEEGQHKCCVRLNWNTSTTTSQLSHKHHNFRIISQAPHLLKSSRRWEIVLACGNRLRSNVRVKENKTKEFHQIPFFP